MVIDSSVIVAVALDEPKAPAFERRIVEDPVRLVSAATLLEAAIVIEARYGDAGGRELDRWLSSIGAEIIPVDLALVEAARRAWRKFGKGRHTAGLNFGDCFSYALAKSRGEVLLYKGNDFSKTDIAG